MSISGIGTGCPAWRETGKSRRNNSGEDFANRIAGMVNRNDSAGSGKTTAVCGRDNYVSGNAASIYGMGVYSGKSKESRIKLRMPILWRQFRYMRLLLSQMVQGCL